MTFSQKRGTCLMGVHRIKKKVLNFRVRIKGSHFAKYEANPNIYEAFFPENRKNMKLSFL